MSGVPIGILIAGIIMVVPVYKILRASHVPIKFRVGWILVALFGMAVGIEMSVLQMQAIQDAATEQEQSRAILTMSAWPNIIFIFSPLTAYIGLRLVHKKPKPEGGTSE